MEGVTELALVEDRFVFSITSTNHLLAPRGRRWTQDIEKAARHFAERICQAARTDFISRREAGKNARSWH
jgi:hypothetical protein